jgi:hypothetical protein
MSNPEAVKLMRLAKKAVSIRESSDKSFNEIIAGLAKEASLNSEEVNRVVEWTNTIKMLSLYKSGSDKTVEFEVADPKEINGLIHKEAAVKVDDFDYIVTKTSLEKVASAYKARPSMPKSDYKLERAPIVKKAYAKLSDIKSKIEESKLLAYREQDSFLNKMAELAENLNKHYSESFSEFEVNARSTFGEKCVPYLGVLEKMASNNNKRALNYSPKNVTKTTDNSTLLKEAMVSSQLHHFYRNTAHSFEKIYEDFRTKVEGKLL